ncbi:MAG: acyltransferase family protein [Planctomycetes bacterium]|nr:acyltransferase family protein [Planctomycetota bacterium]
MLLGIALHASLSFFAFPWPIHDTRHSDLLPLFLVAVHGFRMPLFFLLSGYFTMLVYRRRGLGSLLRQRFARIVLPLVIAVATIVPFDTALKRFAEHAIRPEPAVAEILSGDEPAVRRRLATPGAAERKDAFYGRTPLTWATLHGDPAIVAAVLDAGGDANERDGSGNTPLHAAAFFGRDAVGRLLVERGAEPRAMNVVGRLPAAIMALPADVAAEFAPLVGLDSPSIDDILEGRARLRTVLPAGPNAEGTEGGLLDRLTLAWSRALSSERLRLHLGSWSLHLVQTNVFDHLWFLWFLCWLVAIFAALAVTGLLPSGRQRWWLVAASCLPQAVMGMTLAGSYGPDTSLGVLPKPHVLGFYACFFFFGVATFAAEGLDARLGRRWQILLPAAAVLLAAGIATMNDRLLATILQPAYAWTMSLGLIGLFCRLFPHPRTAVAWLADASYWMYLVHVPLVMVAQLLVREWPLPAGVKFLLILAMVTPILLVSYRWCVRFTPIGRLLNGPREPQATR